MSTGAATIAAAAADAPKVTEHEHRDGSNADRDDLEEDEIDLGVVVHNDVLVKMVHIQA